MQTRKRTSGSQTVLLEGEKLKRLSKLIYKQEVNGIKNNPFRSEYDRRLHLDETRKAYLRSLSITQLASDFSEPKPESKTNAEQEQEQEKEKKKADISTSFKEYLQYVVGYAYSCIPNINLREEYLSRVERHAAELKAEILGLDSSEQTIEKMEELYNRLQTFKRTTFDAICAKADKPYRVLSRVTRPTLKNFTQTYKMVRRKFLMERPVIYNRQYGVKLPLDDKDGMIDSMVDELATENPILKNGARVLKGVGRSIIFLTAAMMVYDAVKTKGSFGDKAEALAKDAGNLAVGYFIGGAAETAVVWGAEFVLGAAVLGASSLLSFGVGVLALGIGFAVAYFAAPCVGKAVDCIVHHIFDLFRTHPAVKKHEEESHPHTFKISVADVKTYVTPPPDGLTLANRLAYKGGN